jgi:hypothetical protein
MSRYRVQIVKACTQFQNLFAYLFPIIFMRVTQDAQKNLTAATAQFCHAFEKDFQPLEAYVKLNFYSHEHANKNSASNSGNGTLMKFSRNQKTLS